MHFLNKKRERRKITKKQLRITYRYTSSFYQREFSSHDNCKKKERWWPGNETDCVLSVLINRSNLNSKLEMSIKFWQQSMVSNSEIREPFQVIFISRHIQSAKIIAATITTLRYCARGPKLEALCKVA